MTISEWFDKSEQHFAFNFYATTVQSEDEVIQKILMDYYCQKLSLGENITGDDFKKAEDYIKLTWKLWKINEKLKDINKDFE
ncbi:MAG: hypothetical protein J6T10_15515 [Methanobrevibacter sp.]|nr:hypothetical protein [Methanobrevibacter sp.]